MRETVELPESLVDVTHLPADIEQRANSGLLIGAGSTCCGSVRFPAAVTFHSGGREGADPQCRYGRRQYPAAHPLSVFL